MARFCSASVLSFFFASLLNCGICVQFLTGLKVSDEEEVRVMLLFIVEIRIRFVSPRVILC